MTDKELRRILKAWITKVLITDGGATDLTIISSHNNAPVPNIPYITINYAGERTKTGTSIKGIDTDEEGIQKVVAEYEVRTEIRLTGGEPTWLSDLAESLDNVDIYNTYFYSNNLSKMQEEPAQPIPRLSQSDDWIREMVWPLNLFLRSVKTQNTGWIDNVELGWSDRPVEE